MVFRIYFKAYHDIEQQYFQCQEFYLTIHKHF